MLIKSGVDAVNGDMDDQDGIRAGMLKADFPSVRGTYRYGPNHFPIQNFYLRKVKEDANGDWFVSHVSDGSDRSPGQLSRTV
jgi:branched-chain amino acid transport system substrate-binding protein